MICEKNEEARDGKVFFLYFYEVKKIIMKKRFCILFFFVAISSYAAEFMDVKYEILRPAYYTLPSNVDSLLLVSCIDNSVALDEHVEHLPDSQLTIVLHRKLSMPAIICNIMQDDINSSGYLRVKVEERTMNWRDLHSQADSLCKLRGVDAVLALTRFDYSANTEIESDTIINDVKFVYGRPYSTTMTQFVLLMPNSQSRRLEQRRDTMSYYPCWISGMDTTIEWQSELYFATAENIGRCEASMFYPTWEIVHRKIMLVNNKKIIDAYRWTERNEWDEAKNLWVEALKDKSDDIKLCAMINIAVYYDHQDNAQEAAMWYSKVLDFIENSNLQKSEEKRIAEFGFRRAIFRMQEQEILDKQMKAE